MKNIKRVKDIKELIDKVMLPNYNYKINLSCKEFMVTINTRIVIIARPICTDTEFHYELALDTQYLYKRILTYEEVVMVKNVLDILEENKKFVLSKLKKYTAEEYKEELRIKEENKKRVMEEYNKLFS